MSSAEQGGEMSKKRMVDWHVMNAKADKAMGYFGLSIRYNNGTDYEVEVPPAWIINSYLSIPDMENPATLLDICGVLEYVRKIYGELGGIKKKLRGALSDMEHGEVLVLSPRVLSAVYCDMERVKPVLCDGEEYRRRTTPTRGLSGA